MQTGLQGTGETIVRHINTCREQPARGPFLCRESFSDLIHNFIEVEQVQTGRLERFGCDPSAVILQRFKTGDAEFLLHAFRSDSHHGIAGQIDHVALSGEKLLGAVSIPGQLTDRKIKHGVRQLRIGAYFFLKVRIGLVIIEAQVSRFDQLMAFQVC